MKAFAHVQLVTVFLAFLFHSSLSHAILLKTETTSKVFEDAKLVNSVVLVNDDKTEVPMKAVSHGLRRKTVFGLLTVNVYVMQLMAATPEKLVKDETKFLDSVKNAGPIQLHFTFLRDLPGEKISSSFKEGLEANGVKTDDKSIGLELGTALKELNAIKEFKKGQNFALTFTWSGDNATVYLTDPSSRIVSITGPRVFADQLLSIWFGKPADSKLEDLKKTMIM
jgi:hypothetical protein